MTDRLSCGLALLLSLSLCPACGGDDPGPGPVPVEPEVAASPTVEDVEDVPDPGPEEVLLPWDLGPDFDIVAADPDVPIDTPGAFSDCPTLGVSSKWAGSFEGIVTYAFDSAGGGAPQEGLFLVQGDLDFEIKCLDKKLLVSGGLSGVAEASGEVGEHPFAAKLAGDFNYITRTIDAKLLDGEVRLFKVVSVYFEGDFDGGVQPDGTFRGTWNGVHVGNDLDLEGDANGSGEWTAVGVFQ